ncbi:NUDIX domain-containing protein [Nocardia panacis]|uniref:NUDIX domain-containing protein n=1 Tax=Nocardia panacis TaxID=2340916 RepID=A0A3A4KJX4_9NOCA|nr:NUDIX domain-containing protein [Nocardia panacis]RJO74090.1 NUDIX domain-containing protein [Nocardia panacis]
MSAPAQPVLRPTARILLVDEDDRILLFSGTDEADGRTFWLPVGGGCDPGETPEQAAIREMREETGLDDIALGPMVWRRNLIATWGGVTYDCREHYFLTRTAAFEVDTSGFTEVERATVTGHHWWTLDELRATTDRLVPRDLARLLPDLLRAGPPRTPILLER